MIKPPSPNLFAWKLLIEKGFHWVRIRATGRVREETLKLSASFSEVPMFVSILVYEI
jgi:hypothetical protein